jgi:hypothetical protein
MRKIAIRLFDNQKFGTTYGKGLRRSAVFNATAEIDEPYAKYLLDFEHGAMWIAHARNDAQLKIANQFVDQADKNENIFWSWVKWYDKNTAEKEIVTGFAAFDIDAGEIALHVHDSKRGLEEEWLLPARRCQSRAGKKSPAFLATNHDLTV